MEAGEQDYEEEEEEEEGRRRKLRKASENEIKDYHILTVLSSSFLPSPPLPLSGSERNR